MNTYITLTCLLAVAACAHGSGYGLGGLGGLGYGGLGLAYSAPIIAPAAVSTQNLIKEAPIPIIKKVVIPAPIIPAPIIPAPIIKVPIVNYGLGDGLGLGYGGLGLKGLDYGLGLGDLGYGLGKVGLGYGKL